MSDNPPDDNLPQGEPEDSATASFWKDLGVYDNQEAFKDPSLPQVHQFKIIEQALLPERLSVLTVQVNGDVLHRALVEATFKFMGFTEKQRNELIEAYQTEDWQQVRELVQLDEEFDKTESAMYWFFVRNLPKLTLRLYKIAALMSVLATLGHLLDEDQRNEKENLSKVLVKQAIAEFQKDIKKMLGTRSSGRPKKRDAGPLPKIVKQVMDTAHRMIGDSTSKNDIPGLKSIAAALHTTEGALGKRLAREGYNWTMLRRVLEEDKN